MASYNRRCRDCGRWINLRQMPQGQWVAFEGDQQHKCDERPTNRCAPPVKTSSPGPAERPAEPFTPLYPKVHDSPTPGPNPIRPQPAPTPVPRDSGLPTHTGSTPTLRPISTPQPTTPPRGASLPTRIGSTPTPRPISAPQPAPPHRPSRLGVILAWITGLLGSTVGLLFAVFGLLSLPLSVVATMHLTGWSWFGAIIGVLFFSCIPLVGQLGYLILAIMGAYYLWTANFDWQQAAYPSAQTFSVSTLSESELERFKVDVVSRGFEKACKSDALKTNGFDGKLPARVASQCECFATNFAAKLTRDDLIAFEKSGRYPDELQQRLGIELRRACPS
jgi:hypothetical protein